MDALVFPAISLLMIESDHQHTLTNGFCSGRHGTDHTVGKSCVRGNSIEKKRLALVFLLLFAGIGFYIVVFQADPDWANPANVHIFRHKVNQYIFTGRRVYARGSHQAQPDPHIVSAMASIQALMENPLQGLGFTYAEQQVGELNRYLFILVSTGVVTFLAYTLFWCGIIYLHWKSNDESKTFPLTDAAWSLLHGLFALP